MGWPTVQRNRFPRGTDNPGGTIISFNNGTSVETSFELKGWELLWLGESRHTRANDKTDEQTEIRNSHDQTVPLGYGASLALHYTAL